MVINPKLANPQAVMDGVEKTRALNEMQVTINSDKAAKLASEQIKCP